MKRALTVAGVLRGEAVIRLAHKITYWPTSLLISALMAGRRRCPATRANG